MKTKGKATALAGFAVILFGAYQQGKTDDPEDGSEAIVSSELGSKETPGWRHYGGSLRGDRFAADVAISPDTVSAMRQAWVFRTGDATVEADRYGASSTFKATPVLFGGALYFSTGFNRVFAVDAATGREVWRYDPEINFSTEYSQAYTSRGVAVWSGSAGSSELCMSRVFLGTLDARLIALDARTGEPCIDFGRRGEIDLAKGIRRVRRGEYSVTSPPTIVGDLVIVGSSIGDNGGTDLEEGAVRAFDVRSGQLRWRFDPIPQGADKDTDDPWPLGSRQRTGGANVWSVMAADAERDLVFLPTTSPSPDFYGGERPGDNVHANSIVALKASTGEVVWSYQLVRHDLWDYDVAAQPLLIDLPVDGATRPAVVIATKMGFVFVLDRETGEPLLPVEDRLTPASDVPGERAALSQPFPSIRLHPYERDDLEFWRRDDAHRMACEAMLEGVTYNGVFTPPSLEGALLFPGNPGGVNWGSMAADPANGVGLVAVNRWPTVVKLIPREDYRRLAREGRLNGVEAEYTEQDGTPYGMARFELYDRSNGLPCIKGPWSTLIAVDLSTGQTLWEQPVGAPESLLTDEETRDWGYFARGGPLITRGGVVFLATPFDFKLSAFDLSSGEQLWAADLPAQPGATPMAYSLDGADYVVVAAGGDMREGGGRGDYLVAFRLGPPSSGEGRPR